MVQAEVTDPVDGGACSAPIEPIQERRLPNEIFILPHPAGYVVSAPLLGLACLAAADVVSVLERALTGRLQPGEMSNPALAQLRAAGLLDPVELPSDPEIDPLAPFQPTSVTFLTTTHCNFRCRYCYASAENDRTEWHLPAARAAIDLVLANARAAGAELSVIAFHGSGEPTLRLDFIREMVEYARQVAAGRVEIFPTVVTNGYLPDKHLAWIAANMREVQVSLDGPAPIHDRQRPLANGRGTFERVVRTIQALEAAGVAVIVKTTVTNWSVTALPEITRFLCETFAARRFHLGPAITTGRAMTTGCGEPASGDFVAGFLAAEAVARQYGRELVGSTALATFPQVRTHFCGVSYPNFAVTPKGNVTACLETIDADDPRGGAIFHFGHFDADQGRYVFDQDQIARLRRHTAPEIPQCQDCFIRWQCAGECWIRWLQPGIQPEQYDFRCRISRALVRHRLFELVNAGPAQG